MQVTYVGPHDEVEIPSLDLVCKRNESIEVDDDIGHELVQQDAWTSYKRTTPKDKKESTEDNGGDK